MVQIANGFKGGWHFAGGGFPGIDKLIARPSGDYEIYLGIEPRTKVVSTHTEARPDGTTRRVAKNIDEFGSTEQEDTNVESVWVASGAVENDFFEHVVCPPETWRKLSRFRIHPELQEDGNKVSEEEYMVFHFAYWQGGGHQLYRSMRHYISSMTTEMERKLETDGG
jgi:hypothetical protein